MFVTRTYNYLYHLLSQMKYTAGIHCLYLQSEDSIPQLTPDQQRQLERIESMPLCQETESPSDIPEWESKTAEEREQILGWFFWSHMGVCIEVCEL